MKHSQSKPSPQASLRVHLLHSFLFHVDLSQWSVGQEAPDSCVWAHCGCTDLLSACTGTKKSLLVPYDTLGVTKQHQGGHFSLSPAEDASSSRPPCGLPSCSVQSVSPRVRERQGSGAQRQSITNTKSRHAFSSARLRVKCAWSTWSLIFLLLHLRFIVPFSVDMCVSAPQNSNAFPYINVACNAYTWSYIYIYIYSNWRIDVEYFGYKNWKWRSSRSRRSSYHLRIRKKLNYLYLECI